MAVRALMRDKEAARRYRPGISSFFQEHETEVRSVIPPEMLPAPKAPPNL
jgi:hypothetical protein